MKTAVVTGASGFIGYHLVRELLSRGVMVYAVIRPNSSHRGRMENLVNAKIIELDLCDIDKLSERLHISCDVFFHLGWECTNRDFTSQSLNIVYALRALEAAYELGCKRFIGIGSQAEYGIWDGLITEEVNPMPVTPYGAAKLAACHLSRVKAAELKMEWIWARLFSIYGPYDGENTLISYLMKTLYKNEIPQMGKALHPWNFLHAGDAARALYHLGLTEHSGGVYNVGSDDIRPLKSFAEAVRLYVAPEIEIKYEETDRLAVPLSVSIEKLKRCTDWRPEISFEEGIKDTYKYLFHKY